MQNMTMTLIAIAVMFTIAATLMANVSYRGWTTQSIKLSKAVSILCNFVVLVTLSLLPLSTGLFQLESMNQAITAIVVFGSLIGAFGLTRLQVYLLDKAFPLTE